MKSDGTIQCQGSFTRHALVPAEKATVHPSQRGFRQRQAVTVTSIPHIGRWCLQTPASSQLTLTGDGTKDRNAEEKVSERTCTGLINKCTLLLPGDAGRETVFYPKRMKTIQPVVLNE